MPKDREALHQALLASGGEQLDADGLVAAAQEAIRRAELESAVTLLDTALLAEPEHASAWSLLGAVREEQGQHDEAKRAYRTALSIDDRDPFATVQLATLHAKSGETDKARSLVAWLLLEEDVPEELRQRAAAVLRDLGAKRGAG